MKKITHLVTLAALLCALTPVTAYAGWQQDGTSWRYETEGQYVTGEQVIDHKAYTFDADGRLLSEGIHRDGMEDDLLSDAFVKTHENWSESLLALDLLNEERRQAGIEPLTLDFDLSVVATYRCAHMNRYNYMNHSYNNEYPCVSNWSAYSGQTAELGEIIQFYSVEDNNFPDSKLIESPREYTYFAHTQYVNSPTHFRIMKKADYRTVGIGFFRNNEGTRDYSTSIFNR